MARSHEKRETPRIQPFVAPCRMIVESRQFTGFVVELSVRGARVLCDDEPPPVGTRAVLEVRFGKQVAHSRLPAEVKWVKWTRQGHHFGLTFTEVAADEQKVLDAIVEEFHRRASQLA
jgi:hypothetical protein